MEAEGAESHTVVLALGDEDTAADHAARSNLFPVDFHFRTYNRFKSRGVSVGDDHKQLVAYAYLCGRCRYDDVAGLIHQTGYDEITLDNVVELTQRFAVDQMVCNLDRNEIRFCV